MSEHGPYNQPPQNPYGGGDGTGGQPPYGPGTGGQPGYGQGPYPGNPGQQEHGMYSGGQPPYGGPGGPGGPGMPGGYPPPQPPQNGGGGKAGLWVVIGGGAIIVVLVIAVIIMLVTRGNSGEEIATGPDETTQATEETDEPAEETDEPQSGGGDGPSGEPPYALPIEPCEAFTEQVTDDFLLDSNPNKNVSDSRASCSTIGDPPEGNDSDAYGSLRLNYSVPYSGSDSIEGATNDFEYNLEYYTGAKSEDYYPPDSIEVNEAVDGLGDQAQLIVTEYNYLDDLVPVAIILVRVGNMNIELTYQINTLGEPDDLVMDEDIEAKLTTAAEDAVAVIGNE